MNGYRQRILTLSAAFALVLGGCGDDDDAPTGPSGSGTAVSADNAGEVQTTLMTAFAAVAAKGPGTHQGTNSGQVVIEIVTGKATQTADTRFSMVFSNFSDDGQLFIDGNLTYEIGDAIVASGDLNLTGTFEGSVGLDLTVSDGQASGTISVNGTSVDIGTPADGGNGGNGTDIGDNKLILGELTVDLATVTCNPNSFGVPRFGFRGENAEDTISANVEVRGTAPENGSVFTLDPDFGGGTSRLFLFYDARNWTNQLDEDNTVTYQSDGTTQSVYGSDIVVANDADAGDTMVISFNIVCQ